MVACLPSSALNTFSSAILTQIYTTSLAFRFYLSKMKLLQAQLSMQSYLSGLTERGVAGSI